MRQRPVGLIRVTIALFVSSLAVCGCRGSGGDAPAPQSAAVVPAITRVSVASDNSQAAAPSVEGSALGRDGRIVAFTSDASFAPADSNGVSDIYLRDRVTGKTTLVSVAFDNTAGDGPSGILAEYISISSDGRYVAFSSRASNLVPGDTNASEDIFLRDTALGTTALVSAAAGGGPSDGESSYPSVSGDGGLVVFASTAGNLLHPPGAATAGDIYLRNLGDNSTARISVASDNVTAADQYATSPFISRNGRYVAFVSGATNLVPGASDGTIQVFVKDLASGAVEVASAADNGALGNGISNAASISADGRFVAFSSQATNLVANDNNGARDVFVRDRQGGRTEMVSVSDAGAPGNARSVPYQGCISDDGRFVVFRSSAGNLVPNDTNDVDDVFLRDRVAGRTYRLSVGMGGAEADAESRYVVISGDGRSASFESSAANLVPGDTNGVADSFVASW